MRTGEKVRQSGGREKEGETNKRNFLADPGVIRLAYSSLCTHTRMRRAQAYTLAYVRLTIRPGDFNLFHDRLRTSNEGMGEIKRERTFRKSLIRSKRRRLFALRVNKLEKILHVPA